VVSEIVDGSWRSDSRHGDGAMAAVAGQTTADAGSKHTLDTLSRIGEAQARLDELLLKYADAHPDVIAARELNRRRGTEIAGLREGDPAAGSQANSNRAYQSVELALNQPILRRVTAAFPERESFKQGTGYYGCEGYGEARNDPAGRG
jgi:hypothetical protein